MDAINDPASLDSGIKKTKSQYKIGGNSSMVAGFTPYKAGYHSTVFCVLTMKRLGSSNSRIEMSTQGLDKSSGGGMVILSPSSADLLASEELSDATLSPSTEPSSGGSDTASSFLAK